MWAKKPEILLKILPASLSVFPPIIIIGFPADIVVAGNLNAGHSLVKINDDNHRDDLLVIKQCKYSAG